jgi:hypothetical protein
MPERAYDPAILLDPQLKGKSIPEQAAALGVSNNTISKYRRELDEFVGTTVQERARKYAPERLLEPDAYGLSVDNQVRVLGVSRQTVLNYRHALGVYVGPPGRNNLNIPEADPQYAIAAIEYRSREGQA